jgi:monovalent cation:H+ antiporter-2, CPA2 family
MLSLGCRWFYRLIRCAYRYLASLGQSGRHTMTGSPGVAFLGDVGVALSAALLGGLVARTLKLPVLIGYLVAGVLIGPHTPGLIADGVTVRTVADLGVALLMFAVGVQFSLEELHPIRRTAILGGMAQLLGTILLGLGLGSALGWGLYGGLFVGCALALSSTAVLLRLLEERGELGTKHGQLMLGLLVVQDLSLVLMVTLLPALATPVGLMSTLGLALLKAVAFLGVTVLLALYVVPKLLDRIAHTGSRELLLLASVCLCLGTGFLADRAGLGLPLGAFLAGIILSESPYAHEVFSQIRPLRDVFSSLFFVSVGMLLDPAFVARNLGAVLATVATILIGKTLLTALSLRWLGWSVQTALRVGLGLAQIGEFSFVLTTLGASRGLISPQISGVLLASALITLLLAPGVYASAAPLCRMAKSLQKSHKRVRGV